MADVIYTLNMTQAACITSYNPSVTGALTVGDSAAVNNNSQLWVKFESFPSSLAYKRLRYVYRIGMGQSQYTNVLKVYAPESSFNANTLTWNNKPSLYFPNVEFYNAYPMYRTGRATNDQLAEFAKRFLKTSCIAFESSWEVSVILSSTWRSAENPYIEIAYDDGADLTGQVYAINNQSGYLNPAVDNTFNWKMSGAGNAVCLADFTIASATFFWREQSASTYNQISRGTSDYVTISADTFPRNATIQWYVTATDNNGTTTSTPEYTINTIDAEAIATVISPINTVEDGGSEITFRWNLSNAYGNEPSRVDLLWKLPSESSQEWHTIISSSDPITQYTTAADYFPAGEIQWLVNAYNQDSVKGSDSQASFICVAAPSTPQMITSDGVPYTTFTWQSEGQQAYKITIDGVDYGVRFGTVKTFSLEEPLQDGDHVFSIITQGVYGLWSQPGELQFTISNTPGNSVALTGQATADAVLLWETESAISDFYVYRDDIKIGHTSQQTFSDRLSIGTHSYYVINKLASGNYTQSNTITLTVEADSVLIAEFPPSEWIDIKLSENSDSQQQFSYQKTQTTRHFYGAAYPILEDSSFEDMGGTYDTATDDLKKAEQIERLKGKVVCAKSKNSVFVGAMSTMQKYVKGFYTAFTFTLTRVHYEDYIDETNG